MRSFPIRFTFLLAILILFQTALFGQVVQPDKIIKPENQDFAEVCILPPTDINAHYTFAPEHRLRKGIPNASESEISIDFVNDCNGEVWPEDAKNAFQYAADLWESHLDTPVPIRIEANWIDLGSGVLASAGPTVFFFLTGDGVEPNTLYSIAQASALTGQDLASENDIDYDIVVNMSCLRDDWYFGTDANPPAGTYDVVTTILHEIGHGIGGFYDTMDAEPASQIGDWGLGPNNIPAIFDLFVLDGNFDQIIDERFYPRPSEQLYDALTGQEGGVYFSGLDAEYALGNMRVPLYAPRPFQSGSSIAHLDQQFFTNTENALMRPQLDQALAIHSPGPVFCGLLNDINWPLGEACIDLLPVEQFLSRPFPTFPENGTYSTSTTPTLMWQEVAGAEQYRVQLAGDYQFEDIIIDEVVKGTSFDIEQLLDFNTLYFWRVQAIGNGGTSNFSSKYRFTTIDAPPAAVVLLQPNDEAVNLRPGFSFVWQEASRAEEYQIQVADNPGFSNPVIDATVSVPRYLNTGILNFSTMYYWRVRGINSTGAGEWSEVRTLTTIIEKPDPVTLTSPSQNENQVPVAAMLNWAESERASEYIIQISENDRFTTDDIIELTSSEAMLTLSNPLEFATIYFWRVKATNIGGESDWSEANKFTTVVRETAIMPNYPNPFNASTTIRFQLSEASDVTLDIFDTVGRRVSVLIDEERPAGVYFERLQASGLASGTYFVRFVAGEFSEIQKMAIIK